jgi:hypothetical protein
MKRAYAVMIALGFAIGIVAVQVTAYCFPLCVLYDYTDPEWLLFGCFMC